MKETLYLTIRELAEKWVARFKSDFSERDIIRLGISGSLPIYINTRSLNRHFDDFGGFERLHMKVDLDHGGDNCSGQRASLNLYDEAPKTLERLSNASLEWIESQSPGDDEVIYSRELGLDLGDFKNSVTEDVQGRLSRYLMTDSNCAVPLSTQDLYVLETDCRSYEKGVESIEENHMCASEKTINLVIAVLKKELIEARGNMNQEGLILELTEKYGSLRGVSETTLQNVFSAANKEAGNRL